ncbi:MAG: hypothetical protein IPL39_17810 [Opitutaceae bacterium]|nr:hypothetical protein [Opitutaceae bacterium]
MRCALRIIALVLVLASLLWWSAAGARIGWWQTHVGVERTDEITGLSVVEWQERFVPGVETPALGLLLGGALLGFSPLFRRKLPTNQKTK